MQSKRKWQCKLDLELRNAETWNVDTRNADAEWFPQHAPINKD